MSEHADVRNWLTALATMQRQCGNPAAREEWAHDSYEALVLAEGRDFTTNPRPKGVRQRKMKNCFGNSIEFCLKDPDRYVYCEGYGLNMMTVNHAWVLDQETGLLIDSTWKQQETCVYVGIEFPFQFVIQSAVDAGYYGIIGNDWLLGSRLLREGAALWNRYRPGNDKGR